MSGHRVINSPHTHFYAATKFAVTALMEGLRNELRALNSNIRVAGLSPGLVDTEFTLRLFPNDRERVLTQQANAEVIHTLRK